MKELTAGEMVTFVKNHRRNTLQIAKPGTIYFQYTL